MWHATIMSYITFIDKWNCSITQKRKEVFMLLLSKNINIEIEKMLRFFQFSTFIIYFSTLYFNANC